MLTNIRKERSPGAQRAIGWPCRGWQSVLQRSEHLACSHAVPSDQRSPQHAATCQLHHRNEVTLLKCANILSGKKYSLTSGWTQVGSANSRELQGDKSRLHKLHKLSIPAPHFFLHKAIPEQQQHLAPTAFPVLLSQTLAK